VSQPLPAVLAVDGGNSKTDLALAAADGTLLALVRGPGMPHKLSEATVQVLGDLVESAAAQAGLRPVAGSGTGPASVGLVADHLVACVANVDLPADERQLERMLADQGWTRTCQVANDTYAVLRAGLDDAGTAVAAVPGRPLDPRAERYWGVAVTCGAGINGAGVAPDGRRAGFLALGEISGDWGGGTALGLKAQWHASRAADGRGPATALRYAVPAHFGLTEPDEVAEAIFRGRVSFGDLAGLSRLVFETADASDDVACGIVTRLAQEIFLLARSVITRLGLARLPVPVVLGGGILAARHSLLIDQVTDLITAEVPGAQVRVVSQPPVVGAALTGLDLAGAPAGAKQRLRDSFAELSEPHERAIR